jgi:hypothetical protein
LTLIDRYLHFAMRGASFLCICLLTMMQILSSRCYCHPLKNTSPRLSALKANSRSKQRHFWWGENSENTNKPNHNLEADDATFLGEANNGGEGKSLVAQFGESTPKISPLLVLPLSRRPVFPGFFATHLVKDEKTLEAIIENHKKGVSYLGLFLQKDKDLLKKKDGNHQVQKNVQNGGVSEKVITSLDQVHTTGTYTQIHNVIKTARVSQSFVCLVCLLLFDLIIVIIITIQWQGGQLLLMAHRRIRLDGLLEPPSEQTVAETVGPPPPAMGKVTFLKLPPSDPKSTTIKAYANEIIAAVRDLVKLNPVAQEHIHEW